MSTSRPERHSTRDERADAYVAASIERRMREASSIVEADPGIATHSIRSASVTGDAQAVRAMLAADPSAATAIDDMRGWPPLLYACYSHWHQVEPSRAAKIAEVVRILLDAGASPRTNDGGRSPYRSALAGSVHVNNPEVARVLLDAGANPDDGQCISEAAGQGDQRCLELLLAHGAHVAGTWALGAAVYADDPEAVTLLLAALASDGPTATAATRALADAAAAEASHDVVAALLAGGADARTTDSDIGYSALRRAVRAGDAGTAALLARHGATDDSTDLDRFVGACRRSDRAEAERMRAEQPDLPARLDDVDRATFVDAAGSAPAAAVALMLDMGFAADDRNASGEQALHVAAYAGNAAVVRLLIDAGADIDARDGRFDGTPLAFATVGSGERDGRPGDWIETVRLLIDAGASLDGVWVAGKPPSEDVADLLRRHGVAPDGGPGSSPAAEPAPQAESAPAGVRGDRATPASGNEVIAGVAHNLELAYRDRDLDLLGSLLHPHVRWTGLCQTRAEVLEWYRQGLRDGTRATVESVEVDRDAVVVGIALSRPAEGARPAPAEHRFQVFTVADGQVVEIHGYEDRAAALARR